MTPGTASYFFLLSSARKSCLYQALDLTEALSQRVKRRRFQAHKHTSKMFTFYSKSCSYYVFLYKGLIRDLIVLKLRYVPFPLFWIGLVVRIAVITSGIPHRKRQEIGEKSRYITKAM